MHWLKEFWDSGIEGFWNSGIKGLRNLRIENWEIEE
jgi:hypothetical protein